MQEIKNIGSQVKSVKKRSEEPTEIIKGLTHDYREIINRIYFYKNDKFIECSDDTAIFWNVVKPYVMHFSKNLDLDTKDFRVIARGDAKYFQAWVLNTKFVKWADDNNFSIVVDDLTQLVCEFGSYVVKLVKEKGITEVRACDLRHLYFDPAVKNIRDSDIVEMHYLTAQEIKAKSDVWDNTEEIVNISDEEKSETDGFKKIEVWEFTGHYNGEYLHAIGAGYGDDSVIAFQENIKKEDCKYYDFHLDKYTGTWLRKGAYETNFILQERANTLVNENAQATNIASLLLLRSEDPNTKGNVLRGAVSGQIVNSRDLQQIAIDNRATGVLLGELDRIEAQVRKNLMLPDIATGDTLPSGTTFRGQALQSNAYKSAFKQMRNRVAEPMKDIIQHHVLPELVRKWDRDEILELAGGEDDIVLYDDSVKIKRKIELLAKSLQIGQPVMIEMLDALDQDTDQELPKVGRKLNHGKGYFDFEYGLLLDPVGETYDKAQQNDALVQAIVMTSQNPAISDIPAFSQLLENNGIKSFRLRAGEKQAIMANNQTGPATQMRPVQQKQLANAVDTAGS